MCVFVSVSLASASRIATVASSSSSAVCQKQAQSVCEVEEKGGLCITPHTPTHSLPTKPSSPSWKRTSSSEPSAIPSQPFLFSPAQPSNHLAPPTSPLCPPGLHHSTVPPHPPVPQSSPRPSPLQRLGGAAQVWIGTLCEQEPARCRGLRLSFLWKTAGVSQESEKEKTQTERWCYWNMDPTPCTFPSRFLFVSHFPHGTISSWIPFDNFTLLLPSISAFGPYFRTSFISHPSASPFFNPPSPLSSPGHTHFGFSV